MQTNSPLDGLDIKIFLLSRDKVRPHDPGLHARGNHTGEHTTKCIETALVRGWYHLGNVHHQWSIRVAILNTLKNKENPI